MMTIATDNVILSGHRRPAACKRAGLSRVRCRREAIAAIGAAAQAAPA
jgi:hypothetical protein